MKVEIISRETIKPSFPTPKGLRNFKLSAIDQLMPPVYASLIFFYSSSGSVCFSERSQQLKKSLSDSLTLYYPLAGELKDNIMIDCSDCGALYVEAQVASSMSHFLEKPNNEELTQLIAIDIESTEAIRGGFLTLVQVSSFDCGGVAIGLSISHKLCDGTTLGTFMKCWATKTMRANEAMVVPLYNATTLFPPMKFPLSIQVVKFEKEKLLKKRLVFEASKIAALKVAASSPNVDRPSRIEAVTAFIWKCALNVMRSNSGSSRPSVLTHAVNIRQRTSPKLPNNSFGNLIGIYIAQKDESKAELQGLVCELREKIQLFGKNYMKLLSEKDASLVVTKCYKDIASMTTGPDIEFYTCTSLCNISLYDIDFGWGRPVWVMFPSANTKGMLMIDTRKGDGSIEAWVTLTKEDMYLFERDPELLAYASMNPSVLDTTFSKSHIFSSLLKNA